MYLSFYGQKYNKIADVVKIVPNISLIPDQMPVIQLKTMFVPYQMQIPLVVIVA
jgi:hypothetical protein